MVDAAAKKTILSRRLRFIAAALASAGVAPACQESVTPVVVVPITDPVAASPSPTASAPAPAASDELVETNDPPPQPTAADVDSDGDGIPDALDACPTTPGPASSTPNRSGCPQVCLSVIAGFSARLRFRSGSSVVEPGDVHLLDDLAAFLKAYTQTSVTCTASRAMGEPASLATQRGSALKAALVARQISAARVTTQTTGGDGATATCFAR